MCQFANEQINNPPKILIKNMAHQSNITSAFLHTDKFMVLKLGILFLLLLSICNPSFASLKDSDSAGTWLQTDYSNINYTTPDTAFFAGFRHDPDFNYSIEKPNLGNFLQLMLYRISTFLNSLFKNKATSYIFFFLFAALFIFLAIKLFDKKVQSAFIFSGRNKMDVTISSPGFNKVDFEKMINNALLARNFQVAVRFLYHKLLFHLNLQKVIELKSEKTSTEIGREISDIELKRMFGQLSGTYNYVWYGQFELDEKTFKQIQVQFSVFFNLLGVKDMQ
jgi:hypothetical protein